MYVYIYIYICIYVYIYIYRERERERERDRDKETYDSLITNCVCNLGRAAAADIGPQGYPRGPGLFITSSISISVSISMTIAVIVLLTLVWVLVLTLVCLAWVLVTTIGQGPNVVLVKVVSWIIDDFPESYSIYIHPQLIPLHKYSKLIHKCLI